jgi:hypothetical protein
MYIQIQLYQIYTKDLKKVFATINPNGNGKIWSIRCCCFYYHVIKTPLSALFKTRKRIFCLRYCLNMVHINNCLYKSAVVLNHSKLHLTIFNCNKKMTIKFSYLLDFMVLQDLKNDNYAPVNTTTISRSRRNRLIKSPYLRLFLLLSHS